MFLDNMLKILLKYCCLVGIQAIQDGGSKMADFWKSRCNLQNSSRNIISVITLLL